MAFLALLELYKQGVIELDQTESFGDIQISWISGATLVDLEPVDSYEG